MLSEAAPPQPATKSPPTSLSPRPMAQSSSPHGSPKLGRVSRKSRSKPRGSGSSSKSRVSVKFTAQNFVKNRSLGEDLEQFYDLGDKIGEGGFGEVFSVVHKKTGAERAVKVIYKTEDSDIDFERVNATIKNEFNVVKSLDHPNLLKQYEMFEDDDKFMIVTDLYRGGELLDELEAIGCFQEDDAAILLNHMLTCINYVHGNNLVHRDLKPENILLEENMKLDDIKIIDFGLAKHAKRGIKFNDFVGTSYYMSPQIVKEEPYTCKCDIWACGVIAFLVLAGYAPFDGQGEGDESIDEICQKIEEGKVVFDDEPEVWDSVTDEAKEFIRFLLAYEEKDRPTAYEALQHPWLQSHRDKTLTQYRRSSSVTAKSALGNMEGFEANCKLKQATYALIASQLLLKSEKEEIDEVFRVLDVDCSGRLSKEEVKCGYKEFYGQELSDEEVAIIFKRVNFSGSGTIEYSEFVVASLMSKDVLNDGKLKAAFEEFDIDGNGYIDLEELKTILIMEDDMDDYVMNKIIKQVDKDGDGQISYEEFKSMMYITASQPTREEHETWMKRRESSTLSDDSMDSSLASRMSSLKSIAGARSVLSIFDVMSDASCRLEFDLLDDSSSEQEHSQAQGNGRRPSVSLSGLTSNEYGTDSGGQPGFRRNRTLPNRFDPRRGFLKVNFSFNKDRAFASLGSLPALGEDMTASERRYLDADAED